MKIHTMNLRKKYFYFIKNGTKRIELRLFDEKRKNIELGDTIEFLLSENEKLKAEVIGLSKYRSFKDLVEYFDVSILADLSMTKKELLDEINQFYPPEKQSKFNVLGICIKLL